MNFKLESDYKNVTVIKFTDNIRFSLDGDSIRDIVRVSFNENSSNAFMIKGFITDVQTGVQEDVDAIVTFKGFFRETVEGKLLIPKDIHPKDYDRFVRLKPYLLTFFHASFKSAS